MEKFHEQQQKAIDLFSDGVRCLYFIACNGIGNRALLKQIIHCITTQKLWQVCTTPVARKTYENAYSLPLCRSLFGQSTFVCRFARVHERGTSFRGIGRILSRVEPLTLWCAKFYRSAWFPLLLACHLVEFDTSVICHLFMHCLGSFLFKDMLLSLHKFAFEGQNMNFTVNMLLTCIILCGGPGFD